MPVSQKTARDVRNDEPERVMADEEGCCCCDCSRLPQRICDTLLDFFRYLLIFLLLILLLPILLLFVAIFLVILLINLPCLLIACLVNP